MLYIIHIYVNKYTHRDYGLNFVSLGSAAVIHHLEFKQTNSPKTSICSFCFRFYKKKRQNSAEIHLRHCNLSKGKITL